MVRNLHLLFNQLMIQFEELIMQRGQITMIIIGTIGVLITVVIQKFNYHPVFIEMKILLQLVMSVIFIVHMMNTTYMFIVDQVQEPHIL